MSDPNELPGQSGPPPQGGGAQRAEVVPVSYAERAMNSLMAMHNDLVAEKERSLDLTRRLMEERQAQAELQSYITLLESELARYGGEAVGSADEGARGVISPRERMEQLLRAVRREGSARAQAAARASAAAETRSAEALSPSPEPPRALRLPALPRPSAAYRPPRLEPGSGGEE